MTACDVCGDLGTERHHVDELPFDWWGIEAGMPADLCDGCHRALEARIARDEL